jgi:hypothetical protein
VCVFVCNVLCSSVGTFIAGAFCVVLFLVDVELNMRARAWRGGREAEGADTYTVGLLANLWNEDSMFFFFLFWIVVMMVEQVVEVGRKD